MKQKIKRNRFIPLIAGVLILAALGGAYIFITSENARKEAEAAADLAAKNAKIMLAEYKNTDVRYIEYSYEDEIIKLEYKNDYWYNSEDNNFPLDQTYPATMAAALASVAADRLVEETASDFKIYGLDSPYAYIKVIYSDGTQMRMVFGDLNSFTGNRYMTIDGTGSVYLVQTALFDYFVYDHNSLILHDVISAVDLSALTEISVTDLSEDGTASIMRYYKESITVTKDDSPDEPETEVVWMLDSGLGQPEAADKDDVAKLLASVINLSLQNCAAYNVRDDETLLKYGLGSKAKQVINIKYTETAEVSGDSAPISSTAARTVDKEFSVAYSEPDENGSVYVNIIGSKLIYSLDG